MRTDSLLSSMRTKQSERQRIIDYLEWYDLLIVTGYRQELKYIDNTKWGGKNKALIGKKDLNKLKNDEVKDILAWCKLGVVGKIKGTSILLDITIDDYNDLKSVSYEVQTDEKVIAGKGRIIKMQATKEEKEQAYSIWMKEVKKHEK